MARWHKKKDLNQNPVFAALRKRRVLVFDTHHVGEGFPDAVTLWPGRTIIELPGGRLRVFDGALVLAEVKGDHGKLRENQEDFRASLGHNPPYLVLRTGEEEL